MPTSTQLTTTASTSSFQLNHKSNLPLNNLHSNILADDSHILLTNRTNKSVHFDRTDQDAHNPVAFQPQSLILPPPPLDLKDLANSARDDDVSGKKGAEIGSDSVSERAVQERYKKLINLVGQVKKKHADSSSLSLSLPLSSARSALTNQIEFEEFENFSLLDTSKRLIHAEAQLEDEYDRKFIQKLALFQESPASRQLQLTNFFLFSATSCDKEEKTMNLYFLDPNTKMIKILKTAHFNAKIVSHLFWNFFSRLFSFSTFLSYLKRATLNYHKDSDTDSTVLKLVKKRR